MIVDGNKKVFIFNGGPDGIAAHVAPSATTTGGNFTTATAPAGDVNGDGYADLVVGALQSYMPGQVYVLFGSASGISNAASSGFVVNGSDTPMGASSAQFGASVDGAGDVNGDGYADLVVGAPDQAHAGTTSTGSVYIYLGGATKLAPYAQSHPLQDTSISKYGLIVKRVNDLNADGYSDLLIGSDTDPQTLDTILCGPATLSTGPQLTAPQQGTGFGAALTIGGVGDINGDGLDDIVIGAPGESPTSGGTPGAIHVFLASTMGGGLTLSEQLPVHFGPDGSGGQFGVVAGAGDVDGDGRADVLVGAGCAPSPTGACSNGTAYLFKGIATGLPTVADQKWVGPDPGGIFAIVASRGHQRRPARFRHRLSPL